VHFFLFRPFAVFFSTSFRRRRRVTLKKRRRTIGRHGRKMHDAERRRRSASSFGVIVHRRRSPSSFAVVVRRRRSPSSFVVVVHFFLFPPFAVFFSTSRDDVVA